MSTLTEATKALLERIEEEAVGIENFVELERYVLEKGDELLRQVFSSLSEDVEERLSPPGEAVFTVQQQDEPVRALQETHQETHQELLEG